MKQVSQESRTNSVLFATSKLDIQTRKIMKRKEENIGKERKGEQEGLFKRIPCGRAAEGQPLPLEHETLRAQTDLQSSSEPARVMPHGRQKSWWFCGSHLGLKKGQVNSGKITFHPQSVSCLHSSSQIYQVQPAPLDTDDQTPPREQRPLPSHVNLSLAFSGPAHLAPSFSESLSSDLLATSEMLMKEEVQHLWLLKTSS